MKLDNTIPKVKAHNIYARLFQAILERRLLPGAYLREQDVASKFKVSRTPVREALRLLVQDGYVRLVPRRGAQVNDFSLRDLFEVYDVRRCLEPFAARLAAERLTVAAETELKDIRKTFVDEKQAEPSTEVFLRQLAADRRLHHLVLELAGNRRIEQMISRMTDITILNYRRLTSAQRLQLSVQEHLRIIDGLLRKDAAEAEAAMVRHLVQAKKDMQELILANLDVSRIPVDLMQADFLRER
jgi:DNA-binding GntR family transcriptional regulator